MKLGWVIGRVTFSRIVPALEGGRFLLVSPLGRDQYAAGLEGPPRMGADPSPVIYDNLGGMVGQVVGFVEGREAAQPFDRPTPVDAINVALADELFYRPWTG